MSILRYFRLYPTHEVQSFLISLSQIQANHWIHRLSRVLNQAFGYEQPRPARELANLESILQMLS